MKYHVVRELYGERFFWSFNTLTEAIRFKSQVTDGHVTIEIW